MQCPVLLAYLLFAATWAWAAEDSQLKPSETYSVANNATEPSETLLAPQLSLNGRLLSDEIASSPENCSSICRSAPDCSWFNFCPAQEGCGTPDGRLTYQQCRLLAPVASSVPQVSSRGGSTVGGFPIRQPPPKYPGFSSFTAQGLSGGDYPCPFSQVEGKCAHGIDAGPIICSSMPDCRTVVILLNGSGTIEGMKGPLAVLKNASLTPAKSYMAPAVYSVQKLEELPMFAKFLPNAAGVYIPPLPSDRPASNVTAADNNSAGGNATAAGNSSAGGNTTAANNATAASSAPPFLGCIISNGTLLDGGAVGQEQQPTAEACCRACRARPNATCNMWRFCAQEGGCQQDTEAGTVALNQWECELQFNSLSTGEKGYPPSVLTRGPDVPFISGFPLVVEGPELEGYDLLPGRGLFSHGRFICPGTLRPELGECVLPVTPRQLAGLCEQDPQCEALILKPGILGSSPDSKMVGLLKHSSNPDRIILTPTGLLYLRHKPPQPSQPPPQPQEPSSLSAVGIAMIAVGSAAAVLVGAAGVLLVLRRRRRQLAAAAADEAAKATAVRQQQQPQLGGSGHSSSHSVQMTAAAGRLPRTDSRTGLIAAAPHISTNGSGSNHGAAAAFLQAGRAEKLWQQQQEEQEQQQQEDGAGAVEAVVRVLPKRLQDWIVSPSDFSYCRWPNGSLQELGAGASARVYKAVLRGEVVAAKEIEIESSPVLLQTFLSEAMHMQNLRHPAVVCLLGVAVLPPNSSPNGSTPSGSAPPPAGPSSGGSRGVLLLEYCEARDLYRALQLEAPSAGTGAGVAPPAAEGSLGAAAGGSSGGEGAAKERLFGWRRRGRRVAYDCARGLAYLHSKGVVHCDIKSSNILLTASGSAKLTDVGLSRLQTKTFLSDLDHIVGTFAWVAPEVLSGGRASSAIDIYSMGVVLWEIVTGERPKRGWLRPPHVPQECPQQVADLIARCTSINPQARPTAQRLMEELGQLLRQ